MTYRIRYHKKVVKFLASHTVIAKRFYDKLKFLKQGQFEKLDIKPMENHINEYRLRIGDYRFLYKLEDNDIFIYFFDADSRGDIYK